MKRTVSGVCAILVLFTLMSVMTSCGKDPERNAGVTESPSAATEDLSSERPGERAAITYRDAYDKFSAEYSRGHAQYVEYVEHEADKLKDDVLRTHDKITEILKEKYDYITEEIGSDMTYDKYYESYVAPYEEYYAQRMEAAEMAKDGYLGLSCIVTYGGNSAGDCAALWRYVQYYNLLQELLELKDFLG